MNKHPQHEDNLRGFSTERLLNELVRRGCALKVQFDSNPDEIYSLGKGSLTEGKTRSNIKQPSNRRRPEAPPAPRVSKEVLHFDDY